MTESEGKIRDKQLHILHNVLPNFALLHGIDFCYASNIKVCDVLIYKLPGYRIEWQVNQNQDIINCHILILRRDQEFNFSDNIVMFSFGITYNNFYEWLCDSHFMPLIYFIRNNIELYWDNYDSIYRYQYAKDMSIDGKLLMQIRNIETEGLLMGML